jgi:uncharacterized sulfatase
MPSRREFAFSLGASFVASAASNKDRPNILWITCEDTGPELGCYGDKYATTPNLDALAAKGLRYTHVWSNAPVCAPARTTIISGMYPPSTGSEHMRSMTRLPEGMRMYPCYLRDAGYYATNNSKEDYNLDYTGKVWDESSPKAHWRNRKPGQPFFAIFNFTTTHESQLRTRPHTQVHDPAKVRVPAYHPDTPEVRQDWAQYYDKITQMDGQAAEVLKQLEADGLADSTIVFFYGDHGSGMPRSKRWPFNSGLHVALILHVPEKFKHLVPAGYKAGGTSDRLVGFVDLAPTLLSLAGIKPPEHMQGQAFAGEYNASPRKYNYGFRGRMDERLDVVRSCTDGRYVYVRHFMPHKIYGQHIAFMFQTPTTRIWKAKYDKGELNEAQKKFWERKPFEELFDLQTDRDEVKNLAGSPAHKQTLERMRGALREWMLSIRDVGLLPEDEIHSRAAGSSPYDVGHDKTKYPFERVLETAELSASAAPMKRLVERMGDTDSAVRYWAAVGVLIRGKSAFEDSRPSLVKLLTDAAPAPQIMAAEAFGTYGTAEEVRRAIDVLMELAPPDKTSAYTSIQALNALSNLGDKAAGVKDAIAKLPRKDPKAPARAGEYVPRLIEDLTRQ